MAVVHMCGCLFGYHGVMRNSLVKLWSETLFDSYTIKSRDYLDPSSILTWLFLRFHCVIKTSQEVRMLSRSLSDCQSPFLNAMISFKFHSIGVCFYWEVVLDFRFGQWKCPKREWGKGHCSKWNKKISMGKFFGTSSYGILMHSGFRISIWKGGRIFFDHVLPARSWEMPVERELF